MPSLLVGLLLGLAPVRASADWPTVPGSPLLLGESGRQASTLSAYRGADGTFVLAWLDRPVGDPLDRIVVQRVDELGATIGPSTGTSTSFSPWTSGTSSVQLIEAANGGAYLAFHSAPPGGPSTISRPYALTYDPSGGFSARSTLPLAVGAANAQTTPFGVSDGAGGAWVAYRESPNPIWVRFYHLTGSSSSNAVTSVLRSSNLTRLGLAPLPGGGILAAGNWRNGSNQDEIVATAFDGTGTPAWSNPTVLEAGPSFTGQSDAAVTTDGGIVVVWSDTNVAPYTISGQRLDANGAASWGASGVTLATMGSNAYDPAPRVISDGAGGVVVVWRGVPAGNGPTEVRAQRLNPSGTPLWAAGGVVVAQASGTTWARIARDGATSVQIFYDPASGAGVRAKRLSLVDGSELWPAAVVVTQVDVSQNPSANVRDTTFAMSDGDGAVFAALISSRVAMVRVRSDGTLGAPDSNETYSMPGYRVATYATVPGPMRIQFAPNGDIYAGRDPLAGGGGSNTALRIHQITNGGNSVAEFGASTIPDPDAVYFDADGAFSGVPGSVMVGSLISANNGRITRITPDGTTTTLHALPGLENPSDFLLDHTGRLLITDAAQASRSGGLWYKTGAGAPVQLFAQTLPNAGTAYVAVDASNRIYTGSADSRVRLYESDGTLVNDNFAQLPGGYVLVEFPPAASNFEPMLLSARTIGGEVYRIDAGGGVTTVGTGFSFPSGFRFGPDGALYMAEHDQNRILRITRRQADLGLEASANPDTIGTIGGQTTWTFLSSNAGPDLAEQTELRFDVPDAALANVLNVVSTRGSCALVGQTHVCSLGTIDPLDTATVTVTLSAVASGLVQSSVTVTSRSRDPNPLDAVQLIETAVLGSCGPITYAGTCEGNTLRYCAGEGAAGEFVAEVDCGTEAFPSGISGVCGLIDASYGYDCMVSAGDPCVFDDGSGVPYVAFCSGSGAGCVLDEASGQALCGVGFGACTSPAPGEAFVPYCEGERWVASCSVNQPHSYDCVALGGTCGTTGCVDLPIDAPCNDFLACGAGLLCDENLGTCIDAASVCAPRVFADRCTGDVFVYCDTVTSRVVNLDCAAGGYTCGEQFTCVEGPTTNRCDEVGPACVGRGANETCSLEDGVYCGRGQSCIRGRTEAGTFEGRCQAAAMCGPGDRHVGCVGQIATFCLGDDVITAAEAGGFDCASIGGRCIMLASGEPGCASGPGGPCQPPSIIPNGTIVCEEGGRCVANADGTGTCEGGVVPDAGIPSSDGGLPPPDAGSQTDAGSGEPPVDDGCGCAVAEPAERSRTGPLAWLALGLFLTMRFGRSRRFL